MLVVTGKGWRDWELEKTDGALRASFRSWLQRKDISPYVADVSQANRGHGGEGAWYVRLRQSKAR